MDFTQFPLDNRLQRGISAAGYTQATPIQIEAIPAALAGSDLIATAQTGTGKTAAFVLPILHRLLNGPRRKSRALIVTPTRELAEQIHGCITTLGDGTGLRSATIYGGVSSGPQVAALRSGVEILIACPGRLLDHMDQRNVRLSGMEVLVLDEADRMLDMGFLPPIQRILRELPKQRQTMLFSATFAPEIEKLAAQALNDRPKRIAVGLSRPAHTVSHALYPVAPHLKTKLLLALLAQTDTDSVLIFTRTKHKASRLAQQISDKGFRTTALHADRTQGQRQKALKGFKDGQYQIMVATDIAARGLDVESISHVINYDIPDTVDAYIHRIGRTGRAERNGDAFTLVVPEDDEMIRALERAMKQPLQRDRLSDFDYDAAEPPRPAGSGRRPQENRPGRGQQRRSPKPSSKGGSGSSAPRPGGNRMRSFGPRRSASRHA